MNKSLLIACVFLLITGCQHGSTEQRGQLGGSTIEKKASKKKQKRVRRVFSPGHVIDQLHGVKVYFNDGVTDTYGRNVTEDGYNLGLKWQCVEFVKRYYYEKLNHKMPDAWGHAKDFYDPYIIDAGFNRQRNLYQFHNPSKHKPRRKDIIVFKAQDDNPFGHVAIISKVGDDYIEIVQQNVGRDSRDRIPLIDMNGEWLLPNVDVAGWLGKRKKKKKKIRSY